MISEPSRLARVPVAAPPSRKQSTAVRWRACNISTATRADAEDYAAGRVDADDLVARVRARFGLKSSSAAKIYPVKLTALTDLMDSLAESTWHSIVEARELEVDFGEVTATHINLLSIKRLARAAGLPLSVEPVSQNVEKRLGADWEFWLLLKSGLALGYSIQAKKVCEDKNGSYEYRELGQGGERPGEKQYDTLIRHAQKYGSIPIHVFYNGWLPSNRIPLSPPATPEQYGCAAVSTYIARDTRAASKGKGMNRASHYASASFPWSDLFRLSSPKPAGRSAANGVDTPAAIPPRDDAIKTDEAHLLNLAERMSELASPGVQFSVAQGLPDYILRARELTPGALPLDDLLPQFAVVLTEG